MAYTTLDWLRTFIVEYGYWAVALALFCENAGVPLPGETTLLLASFLAYSEQRLQLGWIILVGTVAATTGDNLGYAIGYFGGKRLLNRYRRLLPLTGPALEKGEKLLDRYGSVTIFFARFVFGMRVIAGPLAGVLRMQWKLFAIFNLLGAVVWVVTISSAGYFFGRNWPLLTRVAGRMDWAILVIIIVLAACWWKRS